MSTSTKKERGEVTRQERPGDALGVPGRFHNVVTGKESGRILNQQWVSEWRPHDDGRLQVILRFDDECGNGHETFSVTAEWRPNAYRGGGEAFGCLHDEIAAAFPELSELAKWHLVSTDGPLHYLANTIYHAGDRDYNGLRKRELDAARRCAVWPEATDEELSQEPEALTAALLERLPRLLYHFEATMRQIGFVWPEHREVAK